MKNRSFETSPAAERSGGWSCGAVVAGMAMATLLLTTACSGKADNDAQTAATVPGNLTLTADQRKSIHIYTVAQSQFRKTVDATGAVDFDNDLSLIHI